MAQQQQPATARLSGFENQTFPAVWTSNPYYAPLPDPNFKRDPAPAPAPAPAAAAVPATAVDNAAPVHAGPATAVDNAAPVHAVPAAARGSIRFSRPVMGHNWPPGGGSRKRGLKNSKKSKKSRKSKRYSRRRK